MKKLLDTYREREKANESFIFGKDPQWRISFCMEINSSDEHYWFTIARVSPYTKADYSKLDAIDICLDSSRKRILSFTLYFYSKVPVIFQAIDSIWFSNLGKLLTISYSADVIHKNRIFFEKKFIAYNISDKIINIINEFLNCDDKLLKLADSEKCNFFYGFFSKTNQHIVSGVQSLIKKYTLGENKNGSSTIKLMK